MTDRRDPNQPTRRKLLARPGGRRLADKIACPACGGYQSIVKDVRQSLTGIYRRRECQDCLGRYSTEEVFRKYSTKRTKAEREHKM